MVGAEEADWLLCDAYRKWRLLRAAPPVEPFARPARGMILSEGAGALVVAREGDLRLERVHSGRNFSRQRELVRQLDQICREIRNGDLPEVVIASANGTFIDEAERAVYAHHFPGAAIYTPKPALGESVAAGGIWQKICAAQALRRQELPPLLHMAAKSGLTTARAATAQQWRRAVVTTCGLNQQVAALSLHRA